MGSACTPRISLRASDESSGSSSASVTSSYRRESLARERLAENGCVLEQAALLRRQPVEARGDEPVQRLGHLERRDLAGRAVDRAFLNEQSAVEQHPHRLDCVERHAFCARQDLRPQLLWEPGHESIEQLGHRRLRERAEMERREVAVPGAPVRPLVEELGTREDEHEERARLRPLEQVLDEVEQARVGPLHVLEHEDGRVRVREPLEEEPPGGEEVVALVRGLLLGDPEQAREHRLARTPARPDRACAR